MSKLSSTRSTGKSLLFPSEEEIDKWNIQGMRKASMYAKRQFIQSAQPKPNSKGRRAKQQMKFAFNLSIGELREKTKTQKSCSSELSNRLNYFQTDLRRKKQIMQVARGKYKKMMEIRQNSVIEKRNLAREKEIFDKKISESVSLKVSRIKSQRKNTILSAELRREKNKKKAELLKCQREKNEQLIAQRQAKEIEKKRVLVESYHKYHIYSRQKKRNNNQNKFRSIKAARQFELLNEYIKGQVQRLNNIKMVDHFKRRVQQLADESSIINQQLKDYANLLGWSYNCRVAKPATENTVYVTDVQED